MGNKLLVKEEDVQEMEKITIRGFTLSQLNSLSVFLSPFLQSATSIQFTLQIFELLDVNMEKGK